jgi:tetratricopeptide (TPR) repeat protein
MSKDLGPILDGWAYEPDDLQVRIVAGRDGREKLQMRLELGLLQMELEGRPDGLQPHGFESLLDYHESRVGLDESPPLETDDWAALMREGLQYYHRYISLFQLQRYDLVVRDTERNLRLFAFAVTHAPSGREKLEFDQYRPYVIMMHTRALGLHRLDRGEPKQAIECIDRGIDRIREFLREYDREDHEEECSELLYLLRWREHVLDQWQRTPLERLQEQLDQAIAAEDYEEAARVRDQIRRHDEGHQAPRPPGPPESRHDAPKTPNDEA